MNHRSKRWFLLCGIITMLAVVWLLILPSLGRNDRLQREIELMEARGIDPSALYYTDLEISTSVESKLNVLKQAHPKAFW